MKMLKQNSGDKACVAVVAAMAFETSVAHFKHVIQKEPPYTDLDFMKYAFENNSIMGFGISEQFFIKEIDVTDSESKVKPEILGVKRDVHPETIVSIKFQLKDFPAYVVVKAELNDELEHAVYWDGNTVWDPNPTSKNNRPLSDYFILRWYPIMAKINE